MKLLYDKGSGGTNVSNFYSACRNIVEPSNKLKAMFYQSFVSSSTNHGIINEHHVIDLYYHHLLHKNLSVKISKVGLIVSKSHPYLGASLDGLVIESTTREKWVVEVKCPSSQFGKPLEEAVCSKNFFLRKTGNRISLKRTHKYFYQIQGQMFCANLLRADFVVWFGDNQPLFVETIFFDELFWNSKMLSGLTFFYRRAVLLEFYTKRVKSGKKLYLHGGWFPYEEK